MSENRVRDAAPDETRGGASVHTVCGKTRTVAIAGRSFTGDVRSVLCEVAFEHYPVRIDAGDGERVFPSFDGAREYLQTVFGDAD